MSPGLFDSLATTDALAAVFSDASLLQAMLDVEVALARAQAQVGLIPTRAAEAIAAAATADGFDPADIARRARESGTVTIPLVAALTARVRASDVASASFVHWGATSQDIADSALVLTLARARPILAADGQRLARRLRQLSDEHAGSVMLARTLLQPASPTTFGLRAAGWLDATARGWRRVDDAFADTSILQLGGAAGTLASLGDRGMDVGRVMADLLGLALPDAPWHAHRDRLAALVTACGIHVGTLGKIARDITLLMQDEVGEAAERGGGSSSMPHKRNPAGCAIVLAAATRVPGLVAACLTGMIQEHERGVGGWHAEWPTIAAVVQATGAALAALADVAEGLTVDPERMRANITRTGGVIFAERAVMLLAPTVGKETAQALVTRAVGESRASGRLFREVLTAMPEVAQVLSAETLETIDRPEEYLGSADAFRVRLLAAYDHASGPATRDPYP